MKTLNEDLIQRDWLLECGLRRSLLVRGVRETFGTLVAREHVVALSLPISRAKTNVNELGHFRANSREGHATCVSGPHRGRRFAGVVRCWLWRHL